MPKRLSASGGEMKNAQTTRIINPINIPMEFKCEMSFSLDGNVILQVIHEDMMLKEIEMTFDELWLNTKMFLECGKDTESVAEAISEKMENFTDRIS